MDAVVNTVPLARLVALGPDPLLGATGPDPGPDLATFELLVPTPPSSEDPAPPPTVAARVTVPLASVAGPGWTSPPPTVGSALRLEYAANLDRLAAEAGTLGVRVLGPADPAGPLPPPEP